VVEGPFVAHVVDECDGIGTSVECHAEALEAFLTGRVPYLEGDVADGAGLGVGDGDVFGEEVGSDCGFVLAGEFVGVVAVHEGCFTDTYIYFVLCCILCVYMGSRWVYFGFCVFTCFI